MSHYTAEEARRIETEDIDEVHEHFRRLAEAQREDVQRAIAVLRGSDEAP